MAATLVDPEEHPEIELDYSCECHQHPAVNSAVYERLMDERAWDEVNNRADDRDDYYGAEPYDLEYDR